VTLLGTATGAFADKNAGTGKTVTVTGNTISGADSGNYTLAEPTGLTANIEKATLTVSGITAGDKVYDGNTTANVITTGVAYGGLMTGDNFTVSATGQFIDKNAGTAKTVILNSSYGGTDAGNYTIIGQTATTANISPAALRITANNASKIFDGLAYSGGNGVAYSGFVNGETNSVLGGSLTYGGSSQGAFSVGQYSIVPGGLTSSNYTVTYIDGQLTILTSSTTPIYDPHTSQPGSNSPNNPVDTGGSIVDSTSFDDVSDNNLVVNNTPVDDVTGDGLVADNMPVDDVTGDGLVADNMPVDDVSGDGLVADNMPVDDVTGDGLVAGNMPVDDVTGDGLVADNMPVDDITGDGAVAENVPLDDDPYGGPLFNNGPVDDAPDSGPTVDNGPVDDDPEDGSMADNVPLDDDLLTDAG
jgi:hypothetical protein